MTANFFEQQAQARSATNRLIVLYVLAVLSIMTVITLSAHVILLAGNTHRAGRYGTIPTDVPLGADLGIALSVLAVVAIGTFVRMLQIGNSGESVALMLGGIPVDPGTKDPIERRLLNVVEEMAIASGMPVPRVFVLPEEDGINAFAAGLRPGQAVVAVTRGTLEQLTRDELQGVVAHEFSHIFNGDMRLNIRLMGVLGGILAIATIGRLLTYSRSSRSSDRDNGNNLALLGFVIFAVGYIGVFFARLIKAAVSRQREYLADASALQFTRNPSGIGGALMKIRGYAPSSQLHTHYAEEASHMFFGSALKFSSLFATHPPLEDRIGRVDPELLKSGVWIAKPALDGSEAPEVAACFPENSAISALNSSTSTPRVTTADVSTPAAIVSAIGAPSAADVTAARNFLDKIPPSIRQLSRDRQGAVLLVLSLFIESTEIPPEQNAILTASLSAEEVSQIASIRRELATVGEVDRLSLLELSIPPLRQLTESSKSMLLKLGNDLAHADGEVDLYEYVALSLLEHQLMRDLKSRKPRPSISSQQTANDLSILLSSLAYAGADDISAAKHAFDAGVLSLQKSLNMITSFRHLDDCTLEAISASIERLSYLAPDAQRAVIEACVTTILFDGVVSTKESELLRGLCAVLEAPLPALAV